jgi:hypothetical protein
MSKNSIIANLDKDSAINKIKLKLTADTEKKCAILIVEGMTDSKLLKKFVSPNVTIFESPSGKIGVFDIISNKRIQDDRVLGIRDKDYLNSDIDQHIFFYDYSCLEMMLLYDDKTHENAIVELCDSEDDPKIIREKILSLLIDLSILRKLNEIHTIGLRFSGLSLNKIIDANNGFVLKKEWLFSELRKLNKKQIEKFDFLIEIYCKYSECVNCLEDLLDITNGHDYIYAFQCYCNSFVKKKISEEIISRAYRISFRLEAFSNTKLYNDVLRYSEEKALKIWRNI